MNDIEIRGNLHRKILREHHFSEDTLVIDELGLNHGKCRADVAVVNGKLVGFEIKSDEDTLERLDRQVEAYNSIFNEIHIVVGKKYGLKVLNYVPIWWGITVASKGVDDSVSFESIRPAKINSHLNPISIARLLWRDEVVELLTDKNISKKILREPRETLYQHLVNIFTLDELSDFVRNTLKKRKNWRHRKQLL